VRTIYTGGLVSQVKTTTATSRQEGLEILGKSQTVHRLYSLLDGAEKFVILVSPYLSIEKLRDLERNIQSALKRKVTVTLVTRARDAHTAGPSPTGLVMLQALAQMGLRLYEVPDLHAKLYVSERHALVTSLNLIESSFNNSIEIGMWVAAQRPEYSQIMEFIRRELDPHGRVFRPQATVEPFGSTPFMAAEPQHRQKPSRKKKVQTGYCIRCGDALALNPDKPYCPDDYAVWAEYSNPNYRDEYCHGCGDNYPATKNKPFCRDCYDSEESIPF
jgi:hypothetical protein